MKPKTKVERKLSKVVRKKARKPKDLYIGFGQKVYVEDEIEIDFGYKVISSAKARKLAAWLIKASDYLEEKK